MNRIQSLSLNAFRNYNTRSFDDLDHQFIVLIGQNGVGKTNCLEGVSLLSPGRGLRGATVTDCQNNNTQFPWAVSAELMDLDNDTTRLGVGRNPDKPDKKIYRSNGEMVKNQGDLGDIIRTIWLTPQMDGLFLQGGAERRRFFDRIVTHYDASHTGRMTRYEKAMRERLSLLKQAADTGAAPEASWLHALESIMAETSVTIAASRFDVMHKLQGLMSGQELNGFPLPQMHLNGDAEKALEGKSALQAEDILKEKLHDMRVADGTTGRTNIGAHRSDFSVIYDDKNINAAQCSTGEQKALLTTIILSHARMMTARYGAAPILLFDEIAAHFDEGRREALFDILSELKTQIWLSGQDKAMFEMITDKKIVNI